MRGGTLTGIVHMRGSIMNAASMKNTSISEASALRRTAFDGFSMR
jgi:hypothetical protein